MLLFCSSGPLPDATHSTGCSTRMSVFEVISSDEYGDDDGMMMVVQYKKISS